MVDLVLSNQTLCLIHIEISDKFHWSKLNEHLLASNYYDWHNIATFDYLPFIIFYIIFISYSWISEKSDGFQCYLNSVHKKHFAQTLKCSSVEAADREMVCHYKNMANASLWSIKILRFGTLLPFCKFPKTWISIGYGIGRLDEPLLWVCRFYGLSWLCPCLYLFLYLTLYY